MYLNLDLLRAYYWRHLWPGIWALLIVVGHGSTAAIAVDIPETSSEMGAIAAETPEPNTVQAAQVNHDTSPPAMEIPEHSDDETVVVVPGDAESTQVQGDDQSVTSSDVIVWETVSTEASDLLLNDETPEITFLDSLTQTLPAQNSQNRIIAQTEAPSAATASSADLAQQSQNPIASLISVPFQNNINFGVGEFNRTNNTLNIQPVIPLSLSDDLTLINRPIVPLIYQPELARIPLPNGDVESIGDDFGLGDIIYQGYFVPKSSGDLTWGIGPVLLFPTATATSLGTGKWGAGPGAVAVLTTGNIVAGGLINNIWSYAGDSSRSDVSLMTFQPFFNYNFEGGWYASTAPVITANWLGTGEKWTVPVGGGFGRVFKIGEQHVNMSLSAYWNAVKPEEAADWTLRFQATLLFPR